MGLIFNAIIYTALNLSVVLPFFLLLNYLMTDYLPNSCHGFAFGFIVGVTITVADIYH
jgi:hypothetical protein